MMAVGVVDNSVMLRFVIVTFSSTCLTSNKI